MLDRMPAEKTALYLPLVVIQLVNTQKYTKLYMYIHKFSKICANNSKCNKC